MRPLDYVFATAFFCLGCYFLFAIGRTLYGSLVSLKRLIDGAASKVHAHSIKPGAFKSARLIKRKSPAQATSADAVAKGERPMAVRVLPEERDWDIFDVPTFKRREIQLSF